MKKHAYMIMAHNNWKILEKLLLLLDDQRNDIFCILINTQKISAKKYILV